MCKLGTHYDNMLIDSSSGVYIVLAITDTLTGL